MQPSILRLGAILPILGPKIGMSYPDRGVLDTCVTASITT
jgi:hypothetical protein